MKIKKLRYIFILTICFSLMFSWAAFLPKGSALAEENEIADFSKNVYTDQLASGWRDFSWGTVDLGNTDPVHSGAKSIEVSLAGFTGLYLYYPGYFPNGYNYIKFFVHGGTSGGQQLDVYLKFDDNGNYVEGPRLRIPTPQANQWVEVLISLSELGVSDLSITGFVIQDPTGSLQPTFYVDDIAFISDTDASAPTISGGTVTPRATKADGLTKVSVTAQISDPQGLGNISKVFVDGSPFGLGEVSMLDNGLYFDGSAGDGNYGAVFTIPTGTPTGEYVIAVNARNATNNQTVVQAGALAVISQPGGSIPSGLPTRLGWGTNAWAGTAGYDWHTASGVPWNYNYTDITYDWYTGSYPPNFINDFVTQAWNRGEVPVIVVYMMLGLASCGETGECYATTLQDQAKVTTYIDALEKAVQEANGTMPVIFNIEPDFIGFMQQYTNSPSRPAGVQPDDPKSVPVALNRQGYGDNLAGFGQYIVNLVQVTSDNALAAPMVSWWGTGDDPFETIPERVITNAQRTASFTSQMGGDQADLLVVDWGDRDAGSGEAEFWDVTNNDLPRATRANLWNSVLSAVTGKRLLLWQVPAGNMSLDNTPEHYQDNRSEYVFSHPRDLFDSGVVGVMFGGGTDEMTQVWTDGDYIRSQGTVAYANPTVPAGLSVAQTIGSAVTLRWDPNTEPDMWGYILEYSPAGGGTPVEVNVGRANSMRLLIPKAGDYTARVRAYDAMNKQSDFSDSVNFKTTQDVSFSYLPLVISEYP